jgi:long-chain-fatty-acid--CoA ligase ACSBG
MNTVWTSDPTFDLPVKVDAEGFGAREPETVIDVFRKTIENYGSQPAFHKEYLMEGKVEEDEDKYEWRTTTWTEYYNDCRSFAKSLIALDMAPHRCTNIIGFNSPEWFISDMGTILAGGIAAGIYTTNLADACRYVCDHSEAEVVICEGNKQLAKFTEISHELSNLKALVVYGGEIDQEIADQCRVPVHSFEDFLKIGENVPDDELENRMNAQQPGHCCTLIYTSGTTGNPKAVMISHDNITWTTAALLERVSLDHRERMISYLPLSHIAAQILDIHGPLNAGYQIFFARPDALKGSLSTTLKYVHPTIFFGVPRVWEKFYEVMQAAGRSTTGITRSIATWAKEIGTEKARINQFGNGGGAPCGYGVAAWIVFSKIKDKLGFDQCRLCLTGAAPISVEILNYFASIDIPIYEVFGQSECTGPHTINAPEAWKIGTTGRPMRGTQSKITEAGEILYRGRHIFMGYMHNTEKTEETIDSEGWLHSGDVGEFDDDQLDNMVGEAGFMRITGRIKELIITAGGENIPPVLIEQQFQKAMPAISSCCVIGDKRKFLSILIAMKTKVDPETGIPTNELSEDALATGREIGSSAITVEEVMEDENWAQYFERGMAEANHNATSRAQKVQKYAIIPRDFSERGGELTPTLKVKRSIVHEMYEETIEAFYA